MKANAVPVLDLFEGKRQFEVPLFQRQYVWKLDDQWRPLWEDIEGKFIERLDGRIDSPVHFLGAMVLDQKQTPVAYIEKRQVIDGQQRLTTLQLFVAAFRDFCRENGCEALAAELDGYSQNQGAVVKALPDRFKVWPTQGDREQFADAVGLGSRAAIESKHPLVKKKYPQKPDPRPLMIEAYLFFSDELGEFFLGEDAPHCDQPLATRAEECFLALKSALQVVAIDLERDDDAQIIFETLNARGQPLLPSDLLRNYIFLRAGRGREPQEQLHQEYWKGFEDKFWAEEVIQGRLRRPRSDVFMQHFLASRRAEVVPASNLFLEYRHWIERDKPYPTVRAELIALAKQREDFRRLVEPVKGDALHDLARFLIDFDSSTAYPLLLYMFDAEVSAADLQTVAATLESYLVRRTILGWTTKTYTKTFLNLMKALRQSGPTPQAVIAHLSRLQGQTAGWPTDAQFAEAWRSLPAYQVLNNARLVHILRRIGETYRTKKNERIPIEGPLTVEHLLPQSWLEHWPLAGDKSGLSEEELHAADPTDERAVATRKRHAAVQTFGNLTILTQPLNSLLSNRSWEVKKPELLKSSLLPINLDLQRHATWDEDTIAVRSEDMLKRALTIWPGPVAPTPA